MKRIVLASLFLVLAVLVPAAIVFGVDDTSELLGKPAPSVTLKLVDGTTVDIASHKDKDIVVLDFWATWCPPCRMSMPVVTELISKYAAEDKAANDGRPKVILYGVNQGETAEAIKAFLKATELKLNAAVDTERAIGEAFGVRGYPTMVIIGKDGTVQSVHPGLAPDYKEQIKRELDTLISGKNLVEPAKAK